MLCVTGSCSPSFRPTRTTWKAENALDNEVIALITALDPHSLIAWETARKIRDDKSSRLGWDITVTAVTTKE